MAVERVDHIVRGLVRRGVSGTLLVAGGRNAKFWRHCHTSRAVRLSVSAVWALSTQYLDDLVAASEVVITNTCGLMVGEVMARQTPMNLLDLFPSRPGGEECR